MFVGEKPCSTQDQELVKDVRMSDACDVSKGELPTSLSCVATFQDLQCFESDMFHARFA